MVPSICHMWYYTILRLVNSEGNGIFWSILAIYSDYNHKNVFTYCKAKYPLCHRNYIEVEIPHNKIGCAEG